MNNQGIEVLAAAIRRLKRAKKFTDNKELDYAIYYAEKALSEMKRSRR